MIENVFKGVQTKENNPVAEGLTVHENRCYTPNVPKKEWLKEPPFLAKRGGIRNSGTFVRFLARLRPHMERISMRCSDVFTGINTFEYVLKGSQAWSI
ncbi:MAG: hypothetical protein NVS2B12_27380 [Ktedonobacteraceae bacterium]